MTDFLAAEVPQRTEHTTEIIGAMEKKRKGCRYPTPGDGKCKAATGKVCKIKYCVFNVGFPVYKP